VVAGLFGRMADLLIEADVFGQLGFTPNPGPQTTFLNLPEQDIDVLYGGAAGGSKSTSLIVYALRACIRHPGLQAYWFRLSFPEIERSVIRTLGRYGLLAANTPVSQALGAKYNGSTHELRFANGSILTFAHAKNVAEASALLSVEINLLIIDERTTIPPDVIDMLYTRVRSGVTNVPCLGIRSATNPGGVGHSRVKRDYVEATSHGSTTVVDKMGRERLFIQARLADTPQLGGEQGAYAASLGGNDPQLRRAYLEGDWDVFQGQVFSEWRYDRHVVPRFTIPDEWRRIAGIDYGYKAPWAVVWAAVDPDGRLWLYGEEYESGVGETEQAKRILAREAGGPNVLRIADTQMWATTGEDMPIASKYIQAGCAIRKAVKQRLPGWARLHTYLAEAPACQQHRALGWETCPMLHVLDGTCPKLVETLPALPYDKHVVEDVDTAADDHLADALRYLIMSIGAAPVFVFPDASPSHAIDGAPLMVEHSGIAFRPTDTTTAAMKKKSLYAP
jgi:hypothetical protein